MRLTTFSCQGRRSLGVQQGDTLISLKDAAPVLPALTPGDTALMQSMYTFLNGGRRAFMLAQKIIKDVQRLSRKEQVTQGAAIARCCFPLREVRIEAPLDNPQKIIAIGLNYRDHCEEHGVRPPDNPIVFAKFPSAIIGPEDAITWPPELTREVDYEAELAVIIGAQVRNIPAERALECVAGYTIANDVSARDLQFSDGQWVRGKSLDTFCPLGPCLLTKEEVPDPHNLAITCRVNGRTMQQSNTENLIFGIPELISFVSRAFTLFPGDIICTGTPAGVGVYRDPPVFLKPGDEVEVVVEGLGVLRNRVL